jgi:hypothetical protein
MDARHSRHGTCRHAQPVNVGKRASLQSTVGSRFLACNKYLYIHDRGGQAGMSANPEHFLSRESSARLVGPVAGIRKKGGQVVASWSPRW